MTKITKDDFTKIKLNQDWFVKSFDTERKLKNAIEREYAKYAELYNKPLVKKIVINMEYSKNYNVSAKAIIYYVNGDVKYVGGFKAGGYGYDKANSVINQVMDKYALQNLLDYVIDEDYTRDKVARWGFDGQKHAGISKASDGTLFYNFGDDTGKYFNFEIERTADGKNFSQYIVKFFNAANGRMYAHRIRPPVRRR